MQPLREPTADLAEQARSGTQWKKYRQVPASRDEYQSRTDHAHPPAFSASIRARLVDSSIPRNRPILRAAQQQSLKTIAQQKVHQGLQRSVPALAIKQLSKNLTIHVRGILATPPAAIEFHSSPAQPQFPDYDVGYDVANPPDVVPVPVVARPLDGRTSSHTYSMVSENNLPPLLFQIQPYISPLHRVEVPLLQDPETGLTQKGNTGSALRFFSFLPRWIDTNVSGLLLEFWHRLDPRLRPTDITDRFNVILPLRLPSEFSLHLRRTWCLQFLGTPSWEVGQILPLESEVLTIGNLTREQILLNTSMIIDLENNKLLKPYGRIQETSTYVDSGLALDHFLLGFARFQDIPIPANQHVLHLKLHKRLQTLAAARGYGFQPFNYTMMPHNLKPLWWSFRSGVFRSRQMDELDSWTHEQFMYYCAKLISAGHSTRLLAED